MPDIETREDVYLIIKDFYALITVDDVIGHFFNKVVDFTDPDTLEHHLQIVTDFWTTILIGEITYTGNAMRPHLKMNQKSPMKKEHFQRWLLHFNSAIDKHFEGDKVDMMKTRALSIATVMEIKVGTKF